MIIIVDLKTKAQSLDSEAKAREEFKQRQREAKGLKLIPNFQQVFKRHCTLNFSSVGHFGVGFSAGRFESKTRIRERRK